MRNFCFIGLQYDACRLRAVLRRGGREGIVDQP